MAARKGNTTRTIAEDHKRTAALAANAGYEPTRKLSADERAIFNDIISSREEDTWAPIDLRFATELARMTHQLSRLMDRMATEPPTSESARGTPVTNPIYNTTMQLSGAVQAMARTLGLSASQRGASGGEQADRNKAEREARAALEKAGKAGKSSRVGEEPLI